MSAGMRSAVLSERKNPRGAAPAGDADQIRSKINKHKLPPGVTRWSAEYGDDSTGQPAVWIWFHYDDENGVSPRKVNELTNFIQAVRTDLLATKIGRWPYLGFRNLPG